MQELLLAVLGLLTVFYWLCYWPCYLLYWFTCLVSLAALGLLIDLRYVYFIVNACVIEYKYQLFFIVVCFNCIAQNNMCSNLQIERLNSLRHASK